MRALEAADRFLRHLHRPTRILVAVSGGSDSTGLLVALSKRIGSNQSVCAVTVDHALRPEAAAEAEDVHRFCAALGIEHLTLRWDGRKPESAISAMAREARYGLIAEAARRFDADLVVTAHTLDDQNETVLMRAARSETSENRGLAGIAPAVLFDRHLWVARPFLEVGRQEIRDFLRAEGRDWIDDPSNDDPHYERVRIRKALKQGDLLPRKPEPEERTAQALAAAAIIERHVTLHDGVVAHIAPAAFDVHPQALRFALSGLIAFLGGRANGPSSEALVRLIDLIAQREPGRMTLGRVFVALRRDGLYLVRENRDIPRLILSPGEEGVWDGRWRFRNRSVHILGIGASAGVRSSKAETALASLPPDLRRRGQVAQAQIDAPADGPAMQGEPGIAPYDRFLPLFDLPFANSLARLAGRPDFPAPPGHIDLSSENT